MHTQTRITVDPYIKHKCGQIYPRLQACAHSPNFEPLRRRGSTYCHGSHGLAQTVATLQSWTHKHACARLFMNCLMMHSPSAVQAKNNTEKGLVVDLNVSLGLSACMRKQIASPMTTLSSLSGAALSSVSDGRTRVQPWASAWVNWSFVSSNNTYSHPGIWCYGLN